MKLFVHQKKVREFLHKEVVSKIKLPCFKSSDATTHWFLFSPCSNQRTLVTNVTVSAVANSYCLWTQVAEWIRWKKSPKPRSGKREEQQLGNKSILGEQFAHTSHSKIISIFYQNFNIFRKYLYSMYRVRMFVSFLVWALSFTTKGNSTQWTCSVCTYRKLIKPVW